MLRNSSVIIDKIGQVWEIKTQQILLVEPGLSRIGILSVAMMMIFKFDTHINKLVSNGLRETSGIPMTESWLRQRCDVQLWKDPLFWQLGSSPFPLGSRFHIFLITTFLLNLPWHFLLHLSRLGFYAVNLVTEASH